MATDKLFTVCGTAVTPKGETKVRFATDPMRVKVLAKCGDTNIILIELDEPMTKLDAVKFIKDLEEFAGVDEQAAIDDYIERNTPKEKVAKEPKAKKAKPVVEEAVEEDTAHDEDTAAEAVNAELEDEPF